MTDKPRTDLTNLGTSMDEISAVLPGTARLLRESAISIADLEACRYEPGFDSHGNLVEISIVRVQL